MRSSERKNPALLVYRWVFSPLIHLLAGAGNGCRFEPTCSHYCEEALRVHGAFSGALFSLRRLLRCHPFSRAGYDPVPPKS